MNTTLALIDLAGSIALLCRRACDAGRHSARVRPALAPVSWAHLARSSPAFLAGLGTTAVLQSSTATGLMVASFAARGLVDLVPALAVMLGPMSAPP